jgi:hypothetical protein
MSSAVARRKREWFERASRPLERIATDSPNPAKGNLAFHLLEAARFLRYEIEPEFAVAIVKALFGSREPLFPLPTRRYLRLLSTMALSAVRAKALPPKPSGREYQLTAHEERQLVRAYRDLSRFFRQRDGSKVSLADLNEKLASIYPAQDKRVIKQHWPDVIRPRTPRRQAMAVVGQFYPLGVKAIERLCYAADRAGHP